MSQVSWQAWFSTGTRHVFLRTDGQWPGVGKSSWWTTDPRGNVRFASGDLDEEVLRQADAFVVWCQLLTSGDAWGRAVTDSTLAEFLLLRGGEPDETSSGALAAGVLSRGFARLATVTLGLVNREWRLYVL